MEQLCFFPEAGQIKSLPKELLEYRPGLFSKQKGDYLLKKLIAEAPWERWTQKMLDKGVMMP
jgi:hypothetical protein